MNQRIDRGMIPAFLSEPHRGLTTPIGSTKSISPRWTPESRTKRVLSAVEALPRLAAELGLSATDVELLPGSPATIAFTSDGQLRGMVVLPLDEGEALRLLGFPPLKTPDLSADQLWEESRQLDASSPEDSLDEFPVWL